MKVEPSVTDAPEQHYGTAMIVLAPTDDYGFVLWCRDFGSDNAAVYLRNYRYQSWEGSWHPIASTDNMVPATDNTNDLGKSAKRWRNIYAGSSTIVTSDKRQKKDIVSLEQDQILSFLKALNPVQYRFTDGTSGRLHFGLVAQEVEKAMQAVGISDMEFAGFVKTSILDEEGEPTGDYVYGLRYSEFTPVLISAVQYLTDRVEALEKSVRQLDRTNK